MTGGTTNNQETNKTDSTTTSTTNNNNKPLDLENTASQLKTQLEKLSLNDAGQVVEDFLKKRLSDSMNNENKPKSITKTPLPTAKYFPTPTKNGNALEQESNSPYKNLIKNSGSPMTPSKLVENIAEQLVEGNSRYDFERSAKVSSKITIKNQEQEQESSDKKLVTKHKQQKPRNPLSELKSSSKNNKKKNFVKEIAKDYRYFICIDFEATCDGEIIVRDGKTSFRSSRSRGEKFENEIISFPCVIVDIQNHVVVDEFHTYIKPAVNPILTEYCKKLTGIEQEGVDLAPSFSDALKLFEEFFENTGLNLNNTIVVCDSSYDFAGFLRRNCLMTKTKFPAWAKKWVNLKKLFVEFYAFTGNDKQLPTLRSMVESAGLKFKGKLHSGMDDVENMAKLLLRMANDGLKGIKPNELIDLYNGHPFYRCIEGKTIEAEANRLAKLMTGDCKNSTFNEIIKKQLVSPPKNAKKPARRVALLSSAAAPSKPVANSFTTVLKAQNPTTKENSVNQKPNLEPENKEEKSTEKHTYSRKQLLEIGQKLVLKTEDKTEKSEKVKFIYEKALEFQKCCDNISILLHKFTMANIKPNKPSTFQISLSKDGNLFKLGKIFHGRQPINQTIKTKSNVQDKNKNAALKGPKPLPTKKVVAEKKSEEKKKTWASLAGKKPIAEPKVGAEKKKQVKPINKNKKPNPNLNKKTAKTQTKTSKEPKEKPVKVEKRKENVDVVEADKENQLPLSQIIARDLAASKKLADEIKAARNDLEILSGKMGAIEINDVPSVGTGV